MADWQPIETAPKDGTEILAYLIWEDDASPYGCLTLCWVDARDGYWGLSGCSSLAVTTDADISDSRVPTHWMPLPAAPV